MNLKFLFIFDYDEFLSSPETQKLIAKKEEKEELEKNTGGFTGIQGFSGYRGITGVTGYTGVSGTVSREEILSAMMSSGQSMSRLSEALSNPLRERLNRESVARRAFSVQDLPEGALPFYDRDENEQV